MDLIHLNLNILHLKKIINFILKNQLITYKVVQRLEQKNNIKQNKKYTKIAK